MVEGWLHLDQAVTWTAVVFVITVFGLAILQRWWHMGKLARLGYTGPPRHLIFGNLKELGELNGNHRNAWRKLIDKYGSQVGNLEGKSLALYTGGIPIVVVTNPEVIKYIGIKNIDNFTNRLFSGLDRDKSLLSIRDDRWRFIRHTLTPTFSPAKMKLMSETINGVISVTMDIIEEHIKEKKSLNIYRLFHGLTLEVIGKCALAINIDSQRNPDHPLLADCIEAFSNFKSNSLGRSFASIFPSFAIYVRRILGIRFSSIVPEDDTMLIQYVRKVIKDRKANKGSKTVDALQLMLEAAEIIASEEIKDGPATDLNSEVQNGKLKEEKVLQNGYVSTAKENKMTEDEVVQNATVFLLAGYETTSTMLSFTCYLLAKNQDVQQRLYEEIQQHLQSEEEVSYDSVMQMEYLDMVVNESLRFYPPVADSIIREVKEDCEFEGMKFPADAWIIFPISYMHFNEKLWPDPQTFDPERFHPDRKKNIHVSSFLPFGIGPRKCIGLRFALMEGKMALVRLLQRYKLKTCSLTEEDIKTMPGKITLTPQKLSIYLECVHR
ncbi:cytochrome P450 3A24-like isoform X2 [Macrobrachium nipponense]|uniref:cytochrome P450 3A24-like isoform X2 n=1 Tax=Macrobrachium nipponense TaxID=159736 RepID=UPI0030C89BF6